MPGWQPGHLGSPQSCSVILCGGSAVRSHALRTWGKQGGVGAQPLSPGAFSLYNYSSLRQSPLPGKSSRHPRRHFLRSLAPQIPGDIGGALQGTHPLSTLAFPPSASSLLVRWGQSSLLTRTPVSRNDPPTGVSAAWLGAELPLTTILLLHRPKASTVPSPASRAPRWGTGGEGEGDGCQPVTCWLALRVDSFLRMTFELPRRLVGLSSQPGLVGKSHTASCDPPTRCLSLLGVFLPFPPCM